MNLDVGTEFVSVVIPRSVDNRFLFLNNEGRGLWLPTTPRNGDDSLKNVATKFAEEVYRNASSACLVIHKTSNSKCLTGKQGFKPYDKH